MCELSRIVLVFLTVFLSIGFGAEGLFGIEPISIEPTELRKLFREAPDRLEGDRLPLKPLPMWHTNAPITPGQIEEIFSVGQQNGFGGIVFLPLSRTTPKYLSDDYLRLFGRMLETADRLDMKVIFYDDVDFPSGSAGGEMEKLFPADTLKRLDKYEWTAAGPSEFREIIPIPLVEQALFGKPGGVLQAAVAMNMQTFERINLSEHIFENEICWDVPPGAWKIFLYVCVADPHGLVDYMSPEAVRHFFSLTYDKIYERYPNHFGTTIPMVFFDDITNTQTEGSRNWTTGFNAKYRALFHRDPALDYPAAFDWMGDETAAARWRLWTTRNALFADGYPKEVGRWCRERNVLASGHPQGPYTIMPLDMCGDAMLTHRWSDAVLFDSIHYYGHGRDGFKVPTSAAFNFDHPVCVVEIYGNYSGTTFDDSMMYRAAMEIFARGGNMLLPHGIWSDPETVYIWPEISWRNPDLNGCLPEYAKFVSRVQLLLRGGCHIADIGILYPIDSLKSFYHFQSTFITGDYPFGLYMPEETDYLAIGSDLTSRIYRDFTFLHPETLDQKCSIEKSDAGTVLKLNNETNREEYQIAVLTGADIISFSNMEKLAAFHRAGGLILATTHLPSRSAEGTFDEEVCAAVEAIFGIDPRTQAPAEALRTGQEDIVLPENFRNAREWNRQSQAPPSDTEGKTRYVESIVAERAVFVPRPTVEALTAALDRLVPLPDVALRQVGDQPLPALNVTPRWDYPFEGMLQYIHKAKDGLDLYYFANSSNSDVEFDAQLRGDFLWLELWDPHTGETKPVAADTICRDWENDQARTTVRLPLRSIQSVFLVGERKKP